MATDSVPKTQKAVQVTQVGGPEVLNFKTDLPVPTPKENQFLVKNILSGINYIDIYFRSGLYPSPKPEILGREGVGKIVSVGPGNNPDGFKPGDRVVWMGTAGYAEYSVVGYPYLSRVPDEISDEQVVAGFLVGLTSLALVKEAYPVQKGEWILLHAAAGGAGQVLIQLLKKIGAKIIGTAGGPEKIQLIKDLGVDVAIDYKSPEGKDFAARVREVTNGEGVAAVFDSVGKDTWEGSLKAVKRKGTVVFFGNASGPVPPIQLQ